jgi:hypothetical protein
MTKPYAPAVAADRDEGDRIYSSGAHLAIAMRLALYGEASVSELREYLYREGVDATNDRITGVIRDFKRCGYVSGNEKSFLAETALVEVVERRAPSRAYLESNARPLII